MSGKHLVVACLTLSALYAATCLGFYLGTAVTLTASGAHDAAAVVQVLGPLQVGAHDQAKRRLELDLDHSIQMHSLQFNNPLEFRLARAFDFTNSFDSAGEAKVMRNVVEYCQRYSCTDSSRAVLERYE